MDSIQRRTPLLGSRYVIALPLTTVGLSLHRDVGVTRLLEVLVRSTYHKLRRNLVHDAKGYENHRIYEQYYYR